jgi:hypothetical protein
MQVYTRRASRHVIGFVIWSVIKNANQECEHAAAWAWRDVSSVRGYVGRNMGLECRDGY